MYAINRGSAADVEIGDDVWIGAGTMIFPGSKIGQGAVIGAGAVVRGTVAPYEIVVGIPGNRSAPEKTAPYSRDGFDASSARRSRLCDQPSVMPILSMESRIAAVSKRTRTVFAWSSQLLEGHRLEHRKRRRLVLLAIRIRAMSHHSSEWPEGSPWS